MNILFKPVFFLLQTKYFNLIPSFLDNPVFRRRWILPLPPGSIGLRTEKEGGANYGHHMSKAAANMAGRLMAWDLKPKGTYTPSRAEGGVMMCPIGGHTDPAVGGLPSPTLFCLPPRVDNHTS